MIIFGGFLFGASLLAFSMDLAVFCCSGGELEGSVQESDREREPPGKRAWEQEDKRVGERESKRTTEQDSERARLQESMRTHGHATK